jgi:hypothetical protein
MTTSAPRSIRDIPSVAQLISVIRRLQQRVEGRASETGQLEGELKEVVDKASDFIIDLIDMVEQGGLSQEQKGRWAWERECWGRRFQLQ